MTSTTPEEKIGAIRLGPQRLTGSPCPDSADVVRWFGAVQSQDFHGAKWSLSLRCGLPTSLELDAAFDRGDLIRTHILRPTWHFVAPEDLRWIQRLTAPRVHAINGHMKRKLGIEDSVVRRSRTVLDTLLDKTPVVTRDEIGAAFAKAKLPDEGIPLAYLVMNAELEGFLCSGPRRGKQFTYAVVDARIHNHATYDGDEALSELAWRYFRSHGPASARDFSWWSGLSLTTARRAIAASAARLAERVVAGEHYWSAADFEPKPLRSPQVQVVSIYDELLVAYRDHSLSHTPAARLAFANGHEIGTTAVLLNGGIIGSCRKTQRRGVLQMECRLFRELTERESSALSRNAEAYGRHVGMPVSLTQRVVQ